jgi:uncharacterized radical SAM superfamily Fe-S cluster-containing enzyme
MPCADCGDGDGSDRIYLAASRGMCRTCGQVCEARYVAVGNAVLLERICPTHGKSQALVAESFGWYVEAMRSTSCAQPPTSRVVARTGSCPSSCGPCSFHAQRCNLPVLSITNACDLRCPICFTFNRPDARWDMSPEAFGKHMDYVVEATGGVDLVNITGGEPTLHPRLFELIALAKRPGIGRVTLNSNGLTIARDPDLARRLADENVYVILSLDTLDPARSVRIHGRDITGEKKQALENLARFDVQTTLLNVLIGGVNEDELGSMVDLMVSAPFVRSLTIQTMTYTGQGGDHFQPRKHIPVDGVERRIEEATRGTLRQRHFVPLPTAHPLCYGVAYLLVDPTGTPHAFTEILGREGIAKHLSGGYLLHPSDQLEAELRDAIDRLWSEGGSSSLLHALKSMLTSLYPVGQALSVHERQQRAERAVKTIYVHAHMDQDTYEVGRAMRCPDQVPVDAERLIGACNYNLFHRKCDPRFWVER